MLILHWARITVLNLEIEAYEQEILDFYESNPDGGKTKEEKDMMEFKNKFVESAKEELEAVKVKQEKVKRRL